MEKISTKEKPLCKVVLYGPESTGKTMLAMHLSRHFQTLWVPEFARHYLESKINYYDPFGRKSDEVSQPQDIPPIVLGQIAWEDGMAPQCCNNLMICDTNPLMTYVYNEYYFQRKEEWIAEIAIQRGYDLYLLTDIDIPWVADPPLRDRPDHRNELFELFKKELDQRKLPYHLICGDFETRNKTAVELIENLLAKP